MHPANDVSELTEMFVGCFDHAKILPAMKISVAQGDRTGTPATTKLYAPQASQTV